MKRKINIIVTLMISITITGLIALVFKDEMFVKRGQTIITAWSQCSSNGYEFDGQRVKSNAGDPCIYFFSDKNVEQVEIDVTMISNVENLMNYKTNGEDVIYAELFWADENGDMTQENSIPFKIQLGRGSYLLNVDCPAGTMFRLDIGDGADVEFIANSFVFNTYEEYTSKKKMLSILVMFILISTVLYAGLRKTIREQ
ncbi:hypothetical protein SAMN02910413_2294 [Pseudobutyrivibrio sp. C4]|nr:hypothetical protein SAMN02910413_2294 [Pseudobutyrivibrio sp. C4]